MASKRIGIGCVVVAAWLMAWGGGALAQGKEKAPEEVLKERGLSQSGSLYLVEVDAKLPESLRAVRQGKKQVDDYLDKRGKIERELNRVDAGILEMERDYQALNARWADVKGKGAVENNILVGQLKTAESRMREAAKYRENVEKELTKLSDPRDPYVGVLMDVAAKMEAGARRYEELAKDGAVTAALEQINRTARPKVGLGPSPQFAQELPVIRRLRGMVESAAIKFSLTAGVPEVSVTVNENGSVPMIVDSGASMVTLTAASAKRLGIKPGPDDPVVKTIDANGRVTESKVVVLKSVRVGSFVVENVKAAVMPATSQGKHNLLGGTFLRHFVYRLDLAAGEMHVSRVKSKPDEGTPQVAVAPATAPVPAGKGWTILLRSDDPAHWNSTVREGGAYAVPIEQAPKGMKYLRIRDPQGDFRIIPLTFADLGKKVLRERYGWEGRNYEKSRARHLGIVDTTLPRAKTGSIDVTQHPGAGYTGYGFGNRVNKDDVQGYVWAGKPVERMVLEIAVTAEELTEEEKGKLLGE